MFHIELRRFPYQARAFNLSEQDLSEKFLIPWVRGQSVTLDDRRWAPERTRLTIIEGPEIAPEERGMGRGWAAVTREGEEVTDALLDSMRSQLEASSPRAALAPLKESLVAAAQRESLTTSEAVVIAAEQQPGRRPSELLAMAEQAVWELLHEARLTFVRRGESVPVEEWEQLLLRWETWAEGAGELSLRTALDG